MGVANTDVTTLEKNVE